MNNLGNIPFIIAGAVLAIVALPTVLDTVTAIFAALAAASPMGAFVVFIGLLVLLGGVIIRGFSRG